jgi:hypothetical protein
MNRGKMIGYYGNGAPKYENDEANYERQGWSPSYTPNSYGRVDFSRKNNETYKANNGAYSRRYF